MRRLRFILAALLCGCGASQLPLFASAPELAPNSYTHHKTFRYVGKQQEFKVPAHVTRIFVIAIGGEGGGDPIAYSGRVTAVLSVRSGELLYVRVGGNGTNKAAGYNGGGNPGQHPTDSEDAGYGGGGATDIRERSDLVQDRVLVAGGGGGSSGTYSRSGTTYGFGGKGGAKIGEAGGNGEARSRSVPCGENLSGCGGGGGTQEQGGSGGIAGRISSCYPVAGFSGKLGVGGAGGGPTSSSSQPYGCGQVGGGGGGGYYGGGGGGEGGNFEDSASGGGGGGGGGSSYAEASATNVHMWQGWNKNDYGLIVFSW